MKNRQSPPGRPRLSDEKKRGRIIAFKVTPIEYEAIEKKSKNAGMSVGIFCRSSALKSTVKQRLTPDVLAMYKSMLNEFHNVGINLNAIAKKANSGLERNYAADLSAIKVRLQSILDKYKEQLQ